MKAIVPPNAEIHLWFASLDVDEAELARKRELLTSEEMARADRFRVARAARRFVVARAALREVLGQATGVEPAQIEFRYGTHGKPSLDRRQLHFNASDSGDLAVVALAPGEIGVDLEVRRRLSDRDRLARRICTSAELRRLYSLPDDQIDEALLRLWTFKEAALKATGTGLPGGLQNVDVDFGSDRTPRLLRLRDDHDGWHLLTADPEPDVWCSIVVRAVGGPPRIRRHWLETGG
jgi:4'-phosphopantetheinyl transferase